MTVGRCGIRAFIGAIALLHAQSCVWSAPGYSGPKSSHFDGRKFANQGEHDVHGFAKAVWLFAFTSRKVWEPYTVTSTRAAILPIGAFKPEKHMSISHMSPDQALDAHRDLDSHASISMHFGTFQLAFENQGEAEARLTVEAQRRGLRDFVVLAPGEGRELSPL